MAKEKFDLCGLCRHHDVDNSARPCYGECNDTECNRACEVWCGVCNNMDEFEPNALTKAAQGMRKALERARTEARDCQGRTGIPTISLRALALIDDMLLEAATEETGGGEGEG